MPSERFSLQNFAHLEPAQCEMSSQQEVRRRGHATSSRAESPDSKSEAIPDSKSEERLEDDDETHSGEVHDPSGEKQPGWLTAILVGAIAPGVNAPTWAALNMILVLLIATAAALVLPLAVVLQATRHDPSSIRSPGKATSVDATPDGGILQWLSAIPVQVHVLVLIFFALGVLVLLNWLVAEVGTSDVNDQMVEAGLEAE